MFWHVNFVLTKTGKESQEITKETQRPSQSTLPTNQGSLSKQRYQPC